MLCWKKKKEWIPKMITTLKCSSSESTHSVFFFQELQQLTVLPLRVDGTSVLVPTLASILNIIFHMIGEILIQYLVAFALTNEFEPFKIHYSPFACFVFMWLDHVLIEDLLVFLIILINVLVRRILTFLSH